MENYIKLETAKLAKEIGFDIETDKGYFNRGIKELLLWTDCEHVKPEFGYAPTQYFLSDWLRNEFGYHILIIPTVTGDWTYKTIKVVSRQDNDAINGIKDVSDLPPYKEVCGYDFQTHEMALEHALFNSMKQIKENQV